MEFQVRIHLNTGWCCATVSICTIAGEIHHIEVQFGDDAPYLICAFIPSAVQPFGSNKKNSDV